MTNEIWSDFLPEVEPLLLHRQAFEVVLILYYCEFIKSVVLDTLNHQFFGQGEKVRRKRNFSEALSVLVIGGTLSPEERIELLELVRRRNDIAHRIQDVIDGRPSDERALRRLRWFADEIVGRLELRYHVPLTLAPFVFARARAAYEKELERLDGEIRHR